ncbi:methylenetetrahydrofolate reductase [Reichenbachiella agarivorans]|uniref:Methylenetetrahydrofolate reductase n=1 Tax=Reichenbachiella agarivorans TaxID=2979464 RepID=A0ABY6CUE0_9BACT|nr:methylenetetrahydrofolate reductase [Reichenbachiella agarivorans]UXP33610.1 methylenetetrahydrofolate reductase [Reichenbachiella agarivorans]
MTLKDKIENHKGGYLFYGLTPPKFSTDEASIQTIAANQIARLQGINLDALVLYDIQDESARTEMPRPFPFMQTLDPGFYSKHYLQELVIPKIIYKSVGKFSQGSFQSWLTENPNQIEYAVFVGSPSAHDSGLTLQEAYEIKQASDSKLMIGGVTIPERHLKKEDEHIRVSKKREHGCQFFISQCVYSLDHAKDFLSDYYYSTETGNTPLAPIIFTLTPCGSLKTLQFMEWLGIHIPKWLKNDLKNCEDILSRSMDICRTVAKELLEYCRIKNIPIGFNIESVAIRKAEIDASIELLREVEMMQRASALKNQLLQGNK